MTDRALSAENILEAEDTKVKALVVEEWGGTVFIRSLDGEQREDIEIRSQRLERGDVESYRDLKSRVLVYGLCNEKGEPLFEKKHIPLLKKKDGGVLDRVSTAILTLSGMTKEEADTIAGN